MWDKSLWSPAVKKNYGGRWYLDTSSYDPVFISIFGEKVEDFLEARIKKGYLERNSLKWISEMMNELFNDNKVPLDERTKLRMAQTFWDKCCHGNDANTGDIKSWTSSDMVFGLNQEERAIIEPSNQIPPLDWDWLGVKRPQQPPQLQQPQHSSHSRQIELEELQWQKLQKIQQCQIQKGARQLLELYQARQPIHQRLQRVRQRRKARQLRRIRRLQRHQERFKRVRTDQEAEIEDSFSSLPGNLRE